MKRTYRNELQARAGQALVQQLPIEQKTLNRISRLMKPRNLKILAAALLGGSLLLSLMNRVSEMRMYRAAMARELQKQLDPVNRKLEKLEEQNEELKRQNEELRRSLESVG